MPYLCHYVLIALVSSGVIIFAAILSQKLYLVHGKEPAPMWLRACLCFSSASGNNKVSFDTENFERNTEDSAEKLKATYKSIVFEEIVIRLDKISFVIFILFVIALVLGFIVVIP